MFVIVYRNDSRVLGPFPTERDAWDRVYRVPNALFATREELGHAESNSDFYVTRLESMSDLT